MVEVGQEGGACVRSAFYIDGFNLYHAIDDLGKPHLKWLSYWHLAQKVIPQQSQTLVRVVWCTARHTRDPSKSGRHDLLCRAQAMHGVEVIKGHFVDERRECRSCGSSWQAPSEKEGDINVAINLIRDAFLDIYDHAYLLTADSDQVATVRMMRKQFPAKQITIVVPPGRRRSEHLHHASGGNSIQLSEAHLEWAVSPAVCLQAGQPAVRRPTIYDPPPGWVHPQNRP